MGFYWFEAVIVATVLLAGLHYVIWWQTCLALSFAYESASWTRIRRESVSNRFALPKAIIGVGFLASFVWAASLVKDGSVRAPHVYAMVLLAMWAGICFAESIRDFRAYAKRNLTERDRSR
jgi:hypothetical protein